MEMFSDPKITIVWADEHLTFEAFNLLRRREDKQWSLCDAVSFVVMRLANFSEALTTDKHFEQAGFIKLLQS
jgi:predicted nucleic acid-binding protein